MSNPDPAAHPRLLDGAIQPGIALSELLDGHPVATFVIDNAHVITHWNRACEHLMGCSSGDMIGTRKQGLAFYARDQAMLSDLIVDGDLAGLAQYNQSALIPGAYESEEFFDGLGLAGHWLHFTAAPLRDHTGQMVGAIETMRDVTERRGAEDALRRAYDSLENLVEQRTAQLAEANEQLEDDLRQREQADAELRQRNLKLTELNQQLSMTQQQLVQSEKLASIGLLAAGRGARDQQPDRLHLFQFRHPPDLPGSIVRHVAGLPGSGGPRGARGGGAPGGDARTPGPGLPALRHPRADERIARGHRAGAPHRAGPQGFLARRQRPGMGLDQSARGHRLHPEHRLQRGQVQGRRGPRLRRHPRHRMPAARRSTRCS